ncbi:MAG: hypothetical protein RSE41_02020 [Clostridia bacterium]
MNKKGNIEITVLSLFAIVLVILISCVLLLYTEINNTILAVKNDLFYISQNAYFAMDSSEIVYNNYVVDNSKLNEIVSSLIKLNYPNNDITLNKIEYKDKKVYVDLNIKLKPVVLSSIIGDINLNIKDEIKLTMMEVK